MVQEKKQMQDSPQNPVSNLFVSSVVSFMKTGSFSKPQPRRHLQAPSSSPSPALFDVGNTVQNAHCSKIDEGAQAEAGARAEVWKRSLGRHNTAVGSGDGENLLM